MKTRKGEARRTVPDLVEHPERLDEGEIVDGEPLEDARVATGDFSGKAIQQLLVRRCLLEGVSFAGADLRSVRLRDTRLVRCDLSNASARGLEAIRVEFVDCRLIGIKAIECRMEDVLFERCDSRYAQFQAGVARCSDFIDTQLQEADLRAVDLHNTRFIRSSLLRADLTGAKLAGADLRGAAIDGMIVGAGDVSGAIVSPSQAMELARLLGLRIL